MYSRRNFVRQSIMGLTYSSFGLAQFSAMSGCANPSESEKKQAQNSERQQGKLGIALVGLGEYAGGQLAPALQETQNCYLAGVVSGTPDKIQKWQKKYDIPEKNCYSYETFDSIKDNPDIDIVYIVLPNGLHAEYSIRASQAGKHVICEKPMAVTVEDCDRMIAAAEKAGKMLSIGYRLHFEPYNKEMMRLGQEQVFGPIRKMMAENGMNGTGGWRLDKELAGGGPLMDLGIYCVQGVIYTSGMEPVAVWAQEVPAKDAEKFSEVEAALNWQMEFPGGWKAECKTSYEEAMNLLRAEAKNGWFELSPAYPYSGQQGASSDKKMEFPDVNQQARQMDDFAEAILKNRPTPVPGEMGRRDVKILNAIYEAMRTGKRVEV